MAFAALTSAAILHRRTFDGAERAEHAAVAGIWAKHRLAVGALVEELAGVNRHRFSVCEPAFGARQNRFEDGVHWLSPAS